MARRRALALLLCLYLLWVDAGARSEEAQSAADQGNGAVNVAGDAFLPMTSFESYLWSAPLIMQREERFYTDPVFWYLNKRFSKRGCGPASITNGMLSAFGVTDPELARGLLVDLMRLLPYNHLPKTTPVDVNHLDRLAGFDPEKYPSLAELVRRSDAEMIGRFAFMDGPTTMLELVPRLAEGKSVYFATRFRASTQWGDLVDLCQRLSAWGFTNARVSVAFLSTGTESTSAPFRLEDGHYITFTMEAEDFLDHHRLYLLDSNPRALPGEALDQVNYFSRYPLGRSGKTIEDVFQLTRIKDTVVRLEPTEAQHAVLDACQDEAALRDARVAWLSRLTTYGTGILMVGAMYQTYTPAAAEP